MQQNKSVSPHTYTCIQVRYPLVLACVCVYIEDVQINCIHYSLTLIRTLLRVLLTDNSGNDNSERAKLPPPPPHNRDRKTDWDETMAAGRGVRGVRQY